MLTFPIPVFASAVLVFLLARGLFRRDLPLSLQMLLLMCAVQNAVVALGISTDWIPFSLYTH